MIDAYLRDLCRTSAQATIDSHRSQLRLFLIWCLERKVVDASALSRSLIESYDADRAALGRESSTRRTTLGIVAQWWRWCSEHEEHRSYVSPLARPRMPPRVVHEVIAPEWAEVDAVVALAKDFATAKKHAPIWSAVYRLTVLLRGTGLRLSQCLALEWRDLDLRLGTVRIRPELGKTSSERTGRVLPVAPWLLAEALCWESDEDRVGLLVWVPARKRRAVTDGTRVRVAASVGADRVHELWDTVLIDGRPVRPEVYERRPDHAFRKALRTELLHARCHPEAIEYWCGRSTGTRGDYLGRGGPVWQSDGERLDGYARVFRWVQNRVFVPTADVADPIAVERAFYEGRVAVVFEVLGEPPHPALIAESPDGALHDLGATVSLAAGTMLWARSPDAPRPPASARWTDGSAAVIESIVWHSDATGSREVARWSTPGTWQQIPVTAAGAYQLEVLITPHHLAAELGPAAALADGTYRWVETNAIRFESGQLQP